jgi:hypothetical protein
VTVEGAECGFLLSAMRKHNSKRPVAGYVQFLQHYKRKVIETSGSLLSQLLPKSIHAVTAKGFELKVMLLVLIYGWQLRLTKFLTIRLILAMILRSDRTS